jgi:hypothetical protein
MAEIGLAEAICEKHGYEKAPVKRFPIDCIFMSAHLTGSLGRYLSFRQLVGGHRGIFLYIPKIYWYIVFHYASAHQLEDLKCNNQGG